MTAPNFLQHLGMTGLVQQPGIGDVLGQQFQNMAQTRAVVKEGNVRQQQADQLGQYYQGQVNEMQRLRDRQEQEARNQAQEGIRIQQARMQLDRDLPIPPDADEKTRHDILSKRVLRMASYGDPLTGEMTNLMNVMRPKGDKFASSPQGIYDTGTGEVKTPAAPKADNDLMNVAPEGVVFDPVTRQPVYRAPARSRAEGSGTGGAQEQRDMVREERVQNNWEQVVKTHVVRADQLRALGASVDGARKGSAPAQMSMIYSFMKVMDPTSAVREREYANASNAAGVPERVRNIWNKIIDGAILTPEQIDKFYAEAQAQAQAGARDVRNQRKRFDKTVERWRVSPDVLYDPYEDLVPEAPTGNAAAARKAAQGKP